MSIKVYFLLFLVYSFLGWIIEVLYCWYTTKKLNNRGFLLGPICPIYGVGCLLIIILLNRYIEHPVGLFVLSIAICSVLEYSTSYVLEKIFEIRWWDYSDKKYNINGRICLETMIPFGILGSLITYSVNPFFVNIITNINININIINIVYYTLFTLFIADLIISITVVSNIHIITSSIIKDNTEEVKNSVKKFILTRIKYFRTKKESINKKIRNTLREQNIFTKRFINSFPKFKVMKKLKNIKSKDDK